VAFLGALRTPRVCERSYQRSEVGDARHHPDRVTRNGGEVAATADLDQNVPLAPLVGALLAIEVEAPRD